MTKKLLSHEKSDLAQEILRTVPRLRLIVAVGFILEARDRRATGETDGLVIEGDKVDVEAFMATCTVRQLKMLRKIALGLEGGEKVAVH
jgi:hypothetical protein